MINRGNSTGRRRVPGGGEDAGSGKLRRREGLNPVMYFVKKAQAGKTVRTVLTVAAIALAPAFAAGCMSKDDDI